MEKRWKKGLVCVLSALLLWGMPVGNGVSAAETAPEQTVATEAQTEEEPSKAVKIIGFLAIFTVACGVTAYVVMRPSLKKLKEAKQQAAQTESDDSKTE
ncbi:MAG: hypothetical protein ACI4XB_02610 [Ruminococcus sp.]